MVSKLKREGFPDLAYVHSVPDASSENSMPAVMFLGGFKSDMEGTKALYLEEQCRAKGREFMRFDYSGHGQSGGAFADGTIGLWLRDACAVLQLIKSPRVVLVGSSMGGWISLRLLQKSADDESILGGKEISGLVGIAAAPDFTDDITQKMDEAQKQEIAEKGFFTVGHDYGDDPYIFTKALLDDGAQNRVLNVARAVDVPVLLVQGKQDADVAWEKAEAIKKVFAGDQTKIFYVEDGDHRLSRPQDLDLIRSCVCEITDQAQ